MKKRVISIILAAMLVIGLFPATALAAGMGGAGTSASPYLVKTKADLNAVRDNLTAYYRLENDLTFTAADFASGGAFYNGGAGWHSIGDYSGGFDTQFSGSFDGNGKTITGLKQVLLAPGYGGLFGYLASGGVIKNLKLKGGSITATLTTDFGPVVSGGIAGVVSGTVSNCSFAGTVSQKVTGYWSSNAAGGIAGIAYGTVSNCSNSGSISATANNGVAGGIVGSGDTAKISNCSNSGSINGSTRTGGIVGSLTDDGKVSNCSNSANLSGGGGIAGEVEDGSMVDHSYNTGSLNGGAGITPILNGGVITYCYNTGAITGKSVAGIANWVRGSAIEFCYNTGNISASGDRDVYAAGIAAWIGDGWSGGDCLIRNCFNIGAITNTCAENFYSFTGGIIGDVPPYGNRIVNCYNRGSIKYASYYHGGIAGRVDYEAALQNCYYLDTIDHATNTKGTATKVTDAQMKQQSTFKGFDFTNVWTMAGNANYPYPELKNLAMVYSPVVSKQFTVKFNSQGGSAVASIKTASGNKISAPKNPTKSGYSFAGWYKDAACKTAWDFGKDTVTKDITLYAKWTYPLPGKPAISVKSASYNSIKITWKKTARATKYQIYRATSQNGSYKKIAETSAVSYINKSVDTGKTYYYQVRAYYKKGGTIVYSGFSGKKAAKAILPAPAKPKAKKASAASIKLSWSKVAGASGYEILRCGTKNGKYTAAATVKGGTKSSYTNAKLKKGKTYYYKIRAYRTVGGKKVYSGNSSIVSAKL